MIKEIAEEFDRQNRIFDRQNRINVLNLLKQIKDLEYEVKGTYNDILYHKNEKENIEIYLYLSYNQRNINKIDISKSSGWGGNSIVNINTGLDTKEVTAICEELYKKYFQNKKGAK